MGGLRGAPDIPTINLNKARGQVGKSSTSTRGSGKSASGPDFFKDLEKGLTDFSGTIPQANDYYDGVAGFKSMVDQLRSKHLNYFQNTSGGDLDTYNAYYRDEYVSDLNSLLIYQGELHKMKNTAAESETHREGMNASNSEIWNERAFDAKTGEMHRNPNTGAPMSVEEYYNYVQMVGYDNPFPSDVLDYNSGLFNEIFQKLKTARYKDTLTETEDGKFMSNPQAVELLNQEAFKIFSNAENGAQMRANYGSWVADIESYIMSFENTDTALNNIQLRVAGIYDKFLKAYENDNYDPMTSDYFVAGNNLYLAAASLAKQRVDAYRAGDAVDEDKYNTQMESYYRGNKINMNTAITVGFHNNSLEEDDKTTYSHVYELFGDPSTWDNMGHEVTYGEEIAVYVSDKIEELEYDINFGNKTEVEKWNNYLWDTQHLKVEKWISENRGTKIDIGGKMYEPVRSFRLEEKDDQTFGAAPITDEVPGISSLGTDAFGGREDIFTTFGNMMSDEGKERQIKERQGYIALKDEDGDIIYKPFYDVIANIPEMDLAGAKQSYIVRQNPGGPESLGKVVVGGKTTTAIYSPVKYIEPNYAEFRNSQWYNDYLVKGEKGIFSQQEQVFFGAADGVMPYSGTVINATHIGQFNDKDGNEQIMTRLAVVVSEEEIKDMYYRDIEKTQAFSFKKAHENTKFTIIPTQSGASVSLDYSEISTGTTRHLLDMARKDESNLLHALGEGTFYVVYVNSLKKNWEEELKTNIPGYKKRVKDEVRENQPGTVIAPFTNVEELSKKYIIEE